MFGLNAETTPGTPVSPNCGKRVIVVYTVIASSKHELELFKLNWVRICETKFISIDFIKEFRFMENSKKEHLFC